MGFSMGVQVTVEWARRWAETARSFVFLLGMPCNPLRSHVVLGNRVFRRAADLCLDFGLGVAARRPSVHLLSKTALRSRLSYAIARGTGLVTGRFTAEDFGEFIRYSSAVQPDAYLRCATGVLGHDAVETWRRLETPTLFLSAERDVLVPAWDCKRVSSEHPNAVYDELGGASHAGTVEAGDALARRIRAFVETHAPSQDAGWPSVLADPARESIRQGTRPRRPARATFSEKILRSVSA